MAENPLPQQFQLDQAAFPKDGAVTQSWARVLVRQLNQFVSEVVKYLQAKAGTEKVLSFTTPATVADAFPIDFPVTKLPTSVQVGQVIEGPTSISSPVTVQWTALSTPAVRVTAITGLNPSTAYVIRLVHDGQ